MRTVLVAGCAGFLGPHLVRRLLDRGDRVFGIDNLSTGALDNMPSHPCFTFFCRDVRDYRAVDFDLAFNLACPASPVAYRKMPRDTLLTSVLGVDNMLGAARRLVHASTSEVYGDPLESPQRESYWGNVNPIGERACYDEGKRAAEALLGIAHRSGSDVRVARIFNTYGPRMRADDGRVIPTFIMQAISGRPISVQGSGNQTRSFCYVDDLISGLVMLADAERPPLVVNIGNPRETTINELASRIRWLTGSASACEHISLPPDDPVRRVPDITLAQSLGFKPEIDLDEGLRRTIAWFRQRM